MKRNCKALKIANGDLRADAFQQQAPPASAFYSQAPAVPKGTPGIFGGNKKS